MRTPITRARNRSPATASSVPVIEIIAMLWTRPASRSVGTAAVMPGTWPKPNSSAYQMTVFTSIERSGRRGPPVITVIIEPSSPPSESRGWARPADARPADVHEADAENRGEARSGERPGHASGVDAGAGEAERSDQIIGRDRLADERVPQHLVVRPHDADEPRDDEHPHRREHAGERQDHQQRGEHGVDRAHRAEHDPAAERVAQHAEH